MQQGNLKIDTLIGQVEESGTLLSLVYAPQLGQLLVSWESSKGGDFSLVG